MIATVLVALLWNVTSCGVAKQKNIAADTSPPSLQKVECVLVVPENQSAVGITDSNRDKLTGAITYLSVLEKNAGSIDPAGMKGLIECNER